MLYLLKRTPFIWQKIVYFATILPPISPSQHLVRWSHNPFW